MINLSAESLVAHIKAKGYTPQTGYGQFVKHRDLKPEIDMKKFVKIWEQVRPQLYIRPKPVWNKDTHILKRNGCDPLPVEVLEDNGVVIRFVTQWGMFGSQPHAYIDSLETIGEEQ